jgi:hypothetical protein
VVPLEYYRPPQVPAHWVVIALVPNAGQWHQAKAALNRAHIQCLMDDGGPRARATHAMELYVADADAARAKLILDAVARGLTWCPRCGSIALDKLPAPWWWWILACICIGIPPWTPPRFRCNGCGHTWE